MRYRRLGAIGLGSFLGAVLLGSIGCVAGTSLLFPDGGSTSLPGGGGSTDTEEPWQNPYGPGGTDLAADCEAIGQPVDATHQEMYEALNAYRTNNRLTALAYSKRLEAAADAHARDMSERRFFAHENPDGEGPAERALRAGFCHMYVGENIAAGDGLPTVADVQAGWVASPTHNANMLNEPYRLVGMGHYYDPVTRFHYWVQDFALPND